MTSVTEITEISERTTAKDRSVIAARKRRCSRRLTEVPHAVFLIYASPGIGGEATRQPLYFAAAGERKEIWRVPGAEHAGGLEAQPAEYERRVVEFFGGALLGRR